MGPGLWVIFPVTHRKWVLHSCSTTLQFSLVMLGLPWPQKPSASGGASSLAKRLHLFIICSHPPSCARFSFYLFFPGVFYSFLSDLAAWKKCTIYFPMCSLPGWKLAGGFMFLEKLLVVVIFPEEILFQTFYISTLKN